MVTVGDPAVPHSPAVDLWYASGGRRGYQEPDPVEPAVPFVERTTGPAPDVVSDRGCDEDNEGGA
jgi:hypothetical protein